MTSTAVIAVDRVTLENIAQQLEARCDPIAAGQELRMLIASAPVAADADLVDDMTQEISYFGQCRGKVHGDRAKCDCRFCSILRRAIPTTHNHGNKS